VEIKSGALGTKGGPKTNVNANVLNVDGEPIVGLYAAGNVMSSPMGMTYGGAGGTIAPGMVFGYLAGRHAAGMGRATAQAFAEAGARVVLGDWKPIAQQSADTLDLVFDVNVKGVVYGIKHALAVMRPQRKGVIVNVASVQGFRVAYPGAAFYAASKAAVVSLTKAAALENGSDGIRVVGIAPGPIDTPMLRSRAGNEWPPAIVGVTPSARVGEPVEIANASLWLCSDEASYISGATLPVDGGFLAP
jgi:NAD(P)-dependent dehydrogenase (short-subunit alcohol dehydrogenase family)